MLTSLLILYTMEKDLSKSSDAMFWQCWSGLRKSELFHWAEFCKHRYAYLSILDASTVPVLSHVESCVKIEVMDYS